MAYNVGEAYLQITPSFKGVSTAIDNQAKQWGVSSGKAYSDSFNATVRRETNNAPLGPSDSQSTKQGQSSGGKFADGFKARVTAALKSLPDVTLRADSSETDTKIASIRAQLEELSSQRIGIDIDEADAVAKVEALKARLDELAAESPSVAVRMDTAAASAKLNELLAEIEKAATASPNVKVGADTAEADAKLAATKAEADALGADSPSIDVDDHGSIGQVFGELTGLSTLIIGLVPLIAPIGTALVAAFAGLSAVIGSVAGAAGVAVLGFSGVSKAVGLLNQQQQASVSSGGAATNSMNQQATAAQQLKQAELALKNARANADNAAITSAEQVKNARQSLADAEQQAAAQQVSAARSVQQAEYSLAQAAQQSADAQQALNDAREQAARDLLSYADSATDANLNLQQSQIDLINAQNQYQQDLADPTVTPLQLQQDALNVAKAQQQVVEAQQRLQQATEDNNKAQAEGVDGAPGVVSATEQVTQAKHDQQTAAQQLADAEKAQAQQQKQSAEQIAKAERSLSDAIRAQAVQQRQAAYSIEQAQAGVATAMRSVQTASEGAGAAGTSSLASINAQLDKMNPATLQFARFIQGTLEPILNKLKTAAAGGLLPGVEAGLKAMLPVLPSLVSFVGSLARTMGDLFTQAGKALASPFWQDFFAYVSKTAGPTLRTFARIMENLATGFAGLMQAFAPVTSAIGSALEGLTKSFANFGKNAGTNGFQTFLDYVKQYGPVVADALGKFVVDAAHFVTALAPLGGVLAKLADSLLSFLSRLSANQLLGAIGGITAAIAALGLVFDAIPVSVIAVATAIISAVGLIVANWDTIKPHIQPVLNLFQEIWDFITNTLVPVLVGIFKDAWDGIKVAFDTVSNAVENHKTQLLDLRNVFAALVDFVTTKILPLFGPVLKGVFEFLGQDIRVTIDIIAGLVEGFTDLKNAGVAVGNWFAGPFVNFFTGAWSALKSGWTDVRDWLVSGWKAFAKTASNLWSDITSGVSNAWSAVAGAVENVWDKVENAFIAAVNFITQDVINPLIRALDTALSVFGVKIDVIPKIVINKPSTSNNSEPGSVGGGQNAPKAYALGGVAPGYAPGRDSMLAWHSPGEGFIVPEAVRGLGGAPAIQAINAMFSGRVSAPGFSIGGVLGGIGGAVSGAIGGVINKVKQGVADAAAAALDTLEAPIRAAIGLAPSGFAHTLASGLLDKVNSGVKDFIAGNTDHSTSSGSVPSGQHQALIQQALGLAGVPDTAANEASVNTIVTYESGWNPAAINETDSNWLAGHPSVGLMQTIASTFQNWVISSLRNVGPFAYGVSEDPLANMVAGIRYAIGTYGSLENVPGVVSLANGGGYVGYDAGGWLPPGATAALNNTGKPEAIFTNAQTKALLNGAAANSVNHFAVYIGDEAIDPRMVRIVNQTNAKWVTGAQHAKRQGVPGGDLGALNSPHAWASAGS